MRNRPHNRKTNTHRYEYAQITYHTPKLHLLPWNNAENLKETVLKEKPWIHIQSFQKHNAHVGLQKLNQGVQTENSVLELKFICKTRLQKTEKC